MRGGRERERKRGGARERGRGGPPRLCRWTPKKSAERERGGGGGFFPIKQPAEFVFSPKRRCRFKVIDCHREGGTDGPGGERRIERGERTAGGGRGWFKRGQLGTKRSGVAGRAGGTFWCIDREDGYEQHCRSFRSVSFRFASSPFRYVTLRLLGRASPRAI